MDSINRQQPEDNRKHLSGKEGVEKIRELAEKAATCFFCTQDGNGFPLVTRPMAVQKIDDEGKIYFLSSDDSNKNKEIKNDDDVQLLFSGSKHSDFLSIYGKAGISHDQELINELWEPLVKTWFTEGKDDPRISVIIVTPLEGYYWDNKHGNPVALAKMAAGAMLGKTLDDSIEGKITVQ